MKIQLCVRCQITLVVEPTKLGAHCAEMVAVPQAGLHGTLATHGARLNNVTRH